MIAKVLTQVGKAKYTFEFDDKEEMMALHKAIVLGNPPRRCDVCANANAEHFRLETNKDKQGHIYIKEVCLGLNSTTNKTCFAQAKLGQSQPTGSGFFWHKFEVYKKKEEKDGQS